MLYQAKPDPSFSEAELSILQNLKQNGLKLRLHVQAKPPYGFTPDSPDMGIAHHFSPRHSDMEGHFGAEVIIWALESLVKSLSYCNLMTTYFEYLLLSRT